MEFHNRDCMEVMRGYPDKHFDLAIVDPPYGVGDWQTVGDANVFNRDSQEKYGDVSWNNKTPEWQYFKELHRVSREQIIWGANYFNSFSKSGGAIVWDKKSDKSRYSDGDIASCSMQKKITFFRFAWNGFIQENMSEKEIRIHSCQKPVALYSWLLANYAKPGMKILDTHLGSGSIAVACYNHHMSLVGCELDKDYFKSAMDRITRETAQTLLV